MDFENGAWQRVSERCWVAACQPAKVNVGLVVGDETALLIDTGASPEQGAALAKSAAELAGNAIGFVVVTHGHWDHWFGLPGITEGQSIGHENLRELLGAEELAAELAERGIDQAGLIPSTEMSLVKALDLGGVRVEIVHFGEGHTNSDLALLVPGENVIYVGDLLEQGADPSFESNSNPLNWPLVMDAILDGSDAATQFVPGHGEVMSQEAAIEQRGRLGMIYAEAERLAKSGIKEQDAMAALDWPFGAPTMAAALRQSYALLAKKGIKPGLALPLIRQ